MLEVIRTGVKGWIGWTIIGLICLTFALFGLNSYFNGATDPVVAEVNGVKIKQTEFNRSLQQYRERLRKMMGENYRPEMAEGIAAKQSVLNDMIEQRLILQTTQEVGQSVSDSAILKMIHNTPEFQNVGVFDKSVYTTLLSQVGLSPERYEAQLRGDVLSRQLLGSVQKSVLVTSAEVDGQLRLNEQLRDIAYGVVYLADQSDMTVDTATAQAYYDANLDLYRAPEMVSIDYIEFSVAKLAETIDVSDDATLDAFYQENKTQFAAPEQRRVSHILIEVNDEAGAAEARLTAIQSRLAAGEDFATLAKSESEDVGSASAGGDLGYLALGDMEEDFDAAVFALISVGDVSDIIQSESGFHLIALTDIRSGAHKALSDVRSDVVALYSQDQAEKQFYDLIEAFTEASFEQSDSLEAAAEASGMLVETSVSFGRNGGSGIAAEAKVIAAAFNEDVLSGGENSPVIELAADRLVVVRSNTYQAEKQLPFSVSVQQVIKNQLAATQARTETTTLGEQLVTEIREGTTQPTAVFTREGAWQASQRVGRDNEAVNAQIRQHAFSMPKPVNGESSYGGFTAKNGNFIVVVVSDVMEGNVSSAAETVRIKTEGQLSNVTANAEVAALIASLKSSADIEVFTHNL